MSDNKTVSWEKNEDIDKFFKNFKLNSYWFFNGVHPKLKVNNIIDFNNFKIITFTHNNKSFGLMKKNKDNIEILGDNLKEIYSRFKKIEFTKSVKENINFEIKNKYDIKKILKKGVVGKHLESKKINVKLSKEQDLSIHLDDFINQNLKIFNKDKFKYKKSFTNLINKYSNFDKLGNPISVDIIDENFSPSYNVITKFKRFDLANIYPIIDDIDYYYTENTDLLNNDDDSISNIVFVDDLKQLSIYDSYYKRLKNYRNKVDNKKDKILNEQSNFNYSNHNNFLENGNNFENNNTFGHIVGYTEDNNPYKNFIGLNSSKNINIIRRDYISYNLKFDTNVVRSCIIDDKKTCILNINEGTNKIKKNPFENDRIPKKYLNSPKLLKFTYSNKPISKNTKKCTGLNSENEQSYYEKDVELVSETCSEYNKITDEKNIKIVGFYFNSLTNSDQKNTEILIENNLGNLGEKKIYNLNLNHNPYFKKNFQENDESNYQIIDFNNFDKSKIKTNENYLIYFSKNNSKNNKNKKLELDYFKKIFITTKDIIDINYDKTLNLINYKQFINLIQNHNCRFNNISDSLFNNYFFTIKKTNFTHNLNEILSKNILNYSNFYKKINYNLLKYYNDFCNRKINNEIDKPINDKILLKNFNNIHNINIDSIKDEMKVLESIISDKCSKIKNNSDTENEEIEKLYQECAILISNKNNLIIDQLNLKINNLNDFLKNYKYLIGNSSEKKYNWTKNFKWVRKLSKNNNIINEKKIYPPHNISNKINNILKINDINKKGTLLFEFINKYSSNYKIDLDEKFDETNKELNWFYYNPKILPKVNTKICCKHNYYYLKCRNSNDNQINNILFEECIKEWGVIDFSSSDKIYCKNCGEVMAYSKHSEFEGIEKGSGKVINFREIDLSDIENVKFNSFEIKVSGFLEDVLNIIRIKLNEIDYKDVIKLVSNYYSFESLKSKFNSELDYKKIKFGKNNSTLEIYLRRHRWLLSSYYCHINNIKFKISNYNKLLNGEYYQNALNDIDIIIDKIINEMKTENISWKKWGREFIIKSNKKLNFVLLRQFLNKQVSKSKNENFNNFLQIEILKCVLASLSRIITTSNFKYDLYSLNSREAVKQSGISLLNIEQFPELSCNMFSKIILYQKSNKFSIWSKILKNIDNETFVNEITNIYRAFYNSNIVLERIKNKTQTITSKIYPWNNFLPSIQNQMNNDFLENLNLFINKNYNSKNVSSSYTDSILPYNIKKDFNDFEDYDIDYFYKNLKSINETKRNNNIYYKNKLKFKVTRKNIIEQNYDEKYIKKNLIFNIENGNRRIYQLFYDYTGIYEKLKYLNMTDEQFQKNIYLMINKLYKKENDKFINFKVKMIFYLIKKYKNSISKNEPIHNYVEVDTETSEFKYELIKKFTEKTEKENSKILLGKIENVISKKNMIKYDKIKNDSNIDKNFNLILSNFKISKDDIEKYNGNEFQIENLFNEIQENYFQVQISNIENNMKIEGYNIMNSVLWEKEMNFRKNNFLNDKKNFKINFKINLIKFICKTIKILNTVHDDVESKCREWFILEDEKINNFRFKYFYKIYNKKTNNLVSDFSFINEINIKYFDSLNFSQSFNILDEQMELINQFINNLTFYQNDNEIEEKINFIINILFSELNNNDIRDLLNLFVSKNINNNFISDKFIQQKYEFKKNEESAGRKKSSDKIQKMDEDLYNVMFFKRQFNLGKVGFSSSNNLSDDSYDELNLEKIDLTGLNNNIYKKEENEESGIANVRSSEDESEYY